MTVDNIRYAIRFDGTLVDGCVIDSAKRNMAQLLKLGDEALEHMFSGRQVTLKCGLDKQRAEAYQQALRRAGVVASLSPSEAEGTPSSSIVAAKVDADARCPRCAFAQQQLPRCARCHMDLRRHWARGHRA